MDKIAKSLSRLSATEKITFKKILLSIRDDKWKGLDVKKLKGYDNIFRIRKGRLRIIISKMDSSIKVVKIERRTDKIYKLNF